MALLALDRPHGPFAFVLREVGPGTTTWEYTVDPAHFNPNGVLHGGVLMALLDTAMGHAVAALVAPDGAYNAAAQMSVHFLEPIRAGTITARAEVKKCGKRLAVVEAEATDDNGAVRAVATATHAVLKRKPAPPASEPDHS
jgi:uncharacterized protein (TIGR00369 family)